RTQRAQSKCSKSAVFLSVSSVLSASSVIKLTDEHTPDHVSRLTQDSDEHMRPPTVSEADNRRRGRQRVFDTNASGCVDVEPIILGASEHSGLSNRRPRPVGPACVR